ncbi:HNH endonuclease [Bradyrhizobium sp. CCBAU 11430]|uniref:HNH endonuclease n=1 Tax=Bradyrhizobium sp. CCBAU 11430 TaxID=1630881 RepID=UPI003FA4CEF4
MYCLREAWKAGFHLDHIKARKGGGTDEPSNLRWLCRPCHSRKTAKVEGGFGHPRWLASVCSGDRNSYVQLQLLRMPNSLSRPPAIGI